MNISILIFFLFGLWIQIAQSRPQSDEHYLRWTPMFRMPRYERHRPVARGSPEETRIILNEIDKINVAFGYKPKEIILPRQNVEPDSSYFYPRPIADYSNQRPPYYKLPITDKERFGRKRSERYELVYQLRPVPLIDNNGLRILDELLREGRILGSESMDRKITENVKGVPSDIKEGNENNESEIVETIENLLPGPSQQEVEDVYDSLDESSENSNEVEDEEVEGTTLNPPLANDKFLHQEFLQKVPKTREYDRGFNFSGNFIKDLTEKFTKQQTTESPIEESQIHEDLKEKPLDDYDENESEDTEVEGIKAPWSGYLVAGPQNQKDVLKGGGLIIQRLRVRNGSIAVAGPGGVATAGSGGTAIVGPGGAPGFETYLETIKKSASELVKLQQKVTKREKLTPNEENLYNGYMQSLNEAAHNLIEVQKADAELTEFNDHVKGIKSKIEAFGGFKGPAGVKHEISEPNSDTITTKKPSRTTEKASAKPVIIDNKETESISVSAEKIRDGDTVAVNIPPPDASIAEAKPIALSIAGIGGVASAKPVATAVVGPGGLAVARPVATAIAGIDPDEVGGLGVSGLKKSQKPATSAFANYNLASKLQKENGVGTEKQSDKEPIEAAEDIDDNGNDTTRKEVSPDDMKPHMFQPNLDPYNLIPNQFHNTFKIRSPAGYTPTDSVSRGNSNEEEGGNGWSLPPEPNYRLYYTY